MFLAFIGNQLKHEILIINEQFHDFHDFSVSLK